METFSIDMNKKEMKTLSRTNAVNFTEISDGYSYYSDGETSDDLIVDQNASKMMNSSKILSENEKEGDFMVPKVSFHLSITQHLQSIDSKVSERSQPSNFRLFQDEDFFLEKINKPFIPKQTFSKDETVGCVIIDIAHASQYKKVDSDYLRKEPHFIAWNILCPKDTEYISPYVQNNQNNFQNNFHNQFNNFHNNFQNNNFNQNNRIMSNFPYIPNYQNNYQSNFPNCNNFPNNYPNNYQNNYPNNFGDMNNFQILQHNSLPTVSVHDFPTAVHNFYKEKYNLFKTRFKFIHYASPSAEKLNSLLNARKELPTNRLLFHYVGYGFPDPEDGCIYTFNGSNSPPVKYKIKKIFENLRSPAFFIFDCNKAGGLVSALLKHSKKLESYKNSSFMSTTSISLSELSSKMKEKNAGIIPGKNSEKSSESNVEKLKKKIFYRNISWNDWFCLSATAYKETLPKNSKLPRDFLTSCLLTPVETSILCHIIQYYNSTIDDPFQFIKNRFTKNKYSNDLNSFSTSSSTFFSKNSSARSKSKYNLNLSNSSHIEKSSESCTIEQLNSILHSIVDAIASDVVEPHLFTQIFRKDKIISQLFHNFLLSQYLLQPYNIHPLSYPLLPEKTCFHPLWMEWSSILDTLITSTISPLPSFSHNIFSRASSIFNSTVLTNVSNSSHSLDINSDKSKQFLFTNPLNHQPMKKSLLTLMCNVVFSDIPENQSLLQLAEYASKSEENRIDISKRIPFHSLIKKLLKNETKSKEEFHSLCFLILSLLQSNMNHVNEIKNTYDFSQLPSFLFQDEENQTTRSFIAAILSTSVPYVKSLQVLCSSHDFLIELKNHIPKFSPQLLLWNLILLKRTFDISSADESMFSKESIHIQVAACIFHNSPECRAATIASLSCFMQSNDNLINYQLFLLALLSFIDMSYLVRFQFLLFVIRFATTHKNLFETSTLNHFDFSNQISNLNANLNSHPNNSSINTNTIASLNSVKSINSLNSQNLFGGIVGKWLLIPNYDFSSDFESFAKYVDNVCRQDNIIIHVYSLSLFFLDYFTKDPHPSIRSTALKAKTFLTSDVNSCTSSNPNKLSQTNSPSSSSDISPPYKNNSYSNSISPPFGSPLQQHQTNSSNSTNHSNRLAQINQINNKFDQSHQQNSQPSPNVDNPQILNFKLQTPNNSLNAQDKNDAFLDQTNYRKQNSTSLNEESESSNESSQSCLIFDNDSNALFNISLRTIVMQGQWSLNQTSPHFKTRPRRFSNTCTGCIDIPGIQLQLRARTKEINSQPIEIAYDGDKLNMAVATKSKFIYSLNESLFVQNKVRVSDSTISKIKFLSCYHNISSNESININKNISNKNINININRNLSENHSYNKNEIPNNNSPILSKENQSSLLGISTNDGCMHLWDTSHQEVCATWRCDLSNPTIEIPLYFTENEFHQSLITARGNSGICTWDLRTMKLISEYQIFKDNNMNNNSNINNKEKDHNDKEVSSILMHPSNPNLCIIGYNSGLMTAIDFRIGTFQQNSIFSFSLGEKIIELSTNRNGADFIYGATSNGNIIVWNSTKNLLTTSYASRKYGITRFSSHPLLPLLCYSNIQEEPMISNSQCHIFTRMKQITPNSPFLFHPIHPVITFGTTNEELLSYNIVLSPLK